MVYLPTFTININHPWIGKYSSPMALRVLLPATLGLARPFVTVPAVTANDGSDSEGVCWDDLCVSV